MATPEVLTTLATRALTGAFLSERGRPQQATRSFLKKRPQETQGTAQEQALGVLQSLMREADLSAFDARRSSVWWGRLFYILGVPAVILAAAAGTTGLASTTSRVLAALIALASAGFSAAATFLNSQEQHKKSSSLCAAWQELADDARMELLRRAQALEEGKPAAEVFDLEYWEGVLALHRRKGRLLRGDVPADAQVPPTAPISGKSSTSLPGRAVRPRPSEIRKLAVSKTAPRVRRQQGAPVEPLPPG